MQTTPPSPRAPLDMLDEFPLRSHWEWHGVLVAIVGAEDDRVSVERVDDPPGLKKIERLTLAHARNGLKAVAA